MRVACWLALTAPLLVNGCTDHGDCDPHPYEQTYEVFVPAAEYAAAHNTNGVLTEEACIELCEAHLNTHVLACQDNGPAQDAGGASGAPSAYSLTCTVEEMSYCD